VEVQYLKADPDHVEELLQQEKTFQILIFMHMKFIFRP